MATKKTPAAAPAAKGKGWLIILIVVVLVILLAAGGIAWFLAARMDASLAANADPEAAAAPAAAPRGPAQYFLLDPPFVVNLADDGGTRYLQVEVQVLTRDPAAEQVLRTHNPMIRNRLLLLFSQKRSTELRSREEKESLQEAAAEEIRAVLAAESARTTIEAVFFTSFVVQ